MNTSKYISFSVSPPVQSSLLHQSSPVIVDGPYSLHHTHQINYLPAHSFCHALLKQRAQTLVCQLVSTSFPCGVLDYVTMHNKVFCLAFPSESNFLKNCLVLNIKVQLELLLLDLLFSIVSKPVRSKHFRAMMQCTNTHRQGTK